MDRLRTTVRPFLMSSRFQRSITTAVPTVKNVNRPTILHEMVSERKTPVRIIHVHHGFVNSLGGRVGRQRPCSSLRAIWNVRRTCIGACKSECRCRTRRP